MEEEKSEKRAKNGIFSSIFGVSADKAEAPGGRKKLPILLLLCGAIGALLLLLGGNFQESRADAGKENRDAGAVSEATKAELAELLSGVEGAGKTKIYLTVAPGGGALQGVAVLCEGGEDPLVQKRVIGLLSALYNLGAHRIYVGGLESGAAERGDDLWALAYSTRNANIV